MRKSIDESQRPVTKEMWYKGQKHHADLIKQLGIEIVKITEILEELLKRIN